MSGAANCKLKPVFPRKLDYWRNVVSLHALRDERGPSIDHDVPYLPRFVVTRVIGNQDVPPDNTLDLSFACSVSVVMISTTSSSNLFNARCDHDFNRRIERETPNSKHGSGVCSPFAQNPIEQVGGAVENLGMLLESRDRL